MVNVDQMSSLYNPCSLSFHAGPTCTAHCSKQCSEDQVRHHKLFWLAEEKLMDSWRQDSETEPLQSWKKHNKLNGEHQ